MFKLKSLFFKILNFTKSFFKKTIVFLTSKYGVLYYRGYSTYSSLRCFYFLLKYASASFIRKLYLNFFVYFDLFKIFFLKKLFEFYKKFMCYIGELNILIRKLDFKKKLKLTLPFLHWGVLLLYFVYALTYVIFFSDKSFQVMHVFAFYTVFVFLAWIYAEYLKRDFNKAIKRLLILIFIVIIVLLYYQIEYINAKLSVSFPSVRRFIDLSGYASYGGSDVDEKMGVWRKFLFKFFFKVNRFVNSIYYFVTGVDDGEEDYDYQDFF